MLQSPTRIEQIKENFSLAGAIEASPANPKSQPNAKLQQSSDPPHQATQETHQTSHVIQEATVNPPP